MSAPVPGADCTLDELMVVTFSRAMSNDTRAFNGAVSYVPVCGYLLARRTHAPELVWAASSIGIDAGHRGSAFRDEAGARGAAGA